MCANSTPEIVSKIALKVEKPLVLRGLGVPWKCLGSDLSEFCKIFDEINPGGVIFDTAPLKHGSVPQWEHFREKTPQMTLQDFLTSCPSHEGKGRWLSFGYKSFRELPERMRDEIDFAPFGFPDIKEDITLWLGSRGAHTSCHYDTYGRNIVVQVFGHKRWILFSPESDLRPSRIPFEESSVYSGLNFFSPGDLCQFNAIAEKAHIVTLAPGDVLIVPPKWWHFVENLDTALALNAWIPIEQDTDAQMQECFVKSIIFQFLRNVEPQIRKFMIYPNELKDFDEDPFEFLQQHLRILNYLSSVKDSGGAPAFRSDVSDEEFSDLLAKNTSAEFVREATKEEFTQILTENQKRFDESWRFPELTAQQRTSTEQMTNFN
uniref:JmjC domain-containing protein n=1 Tax=Lutzomyia longipalpis TaxID=7200 RepID=A0A1B0CQQ5_LUTLO